MPDRFIYTTDDVLRALDDLLEARGGAWWDGFFADRSKPVPFFADRPDESLVEWFGAGLLAPGRVLELGCGPGRNAVYLAGQGCGVEAVDFSAEAIEWARRRAEAAGAAVQEGSPDLPNREVERVRVEEQSRCPTRRTRTSAPWR